MAPYIDFSGRQIGNWSALTWIKPPAEDGFLWLSQCGICGRFRVVRGVTLKRGKGCRSCGNPVRTHGESHTRLYNLWRTMLNRCYFENSTSYPRYGAKGVTVCDRWRESFEAFRDDMGDKPKGMSLDRIENNKGYSKENCRWATRETQQENTQRAVLLTFCGKTQCASAWERELGLAKDTIYRRRKRGWEGDELFSSTERRANTPGQRRRYGQEQTP